MIFFQTLCEKVPKMIWQKFLKEISKKNQRNVWKNKLYCKIFENYFFEKLVLRKLLIGNCGCGFFGGRRKIFDAEGTVLKMSEKFSINQLIEMYFWSIFEKISAHAGCFFIMHTFTP